MRKIFEATTYTTNGTRAVQDFTSEVEARAFVALAGSGRVVTFVVTPNIANRLPAEVHSSCGMDVFENGAWRGVNIHG